MDLADLSKTHQFIKVSRYFEDLARQTWSALLALAIALAIPGLAAAQNIAVRPRITARADDTVLTVLRGNTHPLARPQNDQGAVADSQPMRRMLLLLQRGPDQDGALKELLDQQQSSASPDYHQWLTPQQFGQQFGPADADIQTVTDWLTSHGFQVARISNGRTLIEFSGTAGQVRNAFHTEIHRYLVNGEQHFANSTDPQIPSALTPVVAGPVSLHNFPNKPLSHTVGAFRKTKATGQVAPLFTIGSGSFCGSTDCNALGPGDFATIYNVFKLWNPGVGGQAIDGTGQTIAIVGDSEICTASSPDFTDPTMCNSQDDVAQFRSLFGLPANSPNVILDGPDPGFNGDETEGDLDVEWSGAVAKNATIDFVIAEDTEATFGTDLAAEYVVDNNLAPVLSESFGECEASLGTRENFFEATLWEQAAAEGITVIVSAGDSGSAGCDDPNFTEAAIAGAAVNGIASTPFNVAAGGTDFDYKAASYQSKYWAPPNNNPPPVDGINYVSALSYIPETTWNDSCAQNFTGALVCAGGILTIVAGGGGQSTCASLTIATSPHCLYYPTPSWQTPILTNDLTRNLPDISLFSAYGIVSNSFYIICEADFSPTVSPCNLSDPYFDFVGVGGTSAAAPTFAGMMALVNQNMAVNHSGLSARQGNANYVLYNLASAQTKSEISCNSSSSSLNSACTFNDITKGNNSVPCQWGSFGCSSATAGVYGVEETYNLTTGALSGSIAWNTAPGRDLATGLGSINAFNLVSNWPTAVGAFKPTTTTLCLSTTPIPATETSCAGPLPAITHGAPVYVNAQVNSNGNPIPVSEKGSNAAGADPDFPQVAEDVSLVGSSGNAGAVDSFTSNNYLVSNADVYGLTNGTISSSTAYLTGGAYDVIAHYTGDGTYGGSDSTPISVTVMPERSTPSITFSTYDPVNGCCLASPVPYGDLTIVRVDIVGNSSGEENATGTVTLTDNGLVLVNPTGGTTLQFPLNTEGYLEDQAPFLAVGSHNIQATYNGDASYNGSSSSATLMVNQAATTTTLTASTTSVVTNQSIALTAFVDTLSVGKNPTGSVTFFNNGVQIGPLSGVPVVPMFDAYGYVAAQATLTTMFSTAGMANITAKYGAGNTGFCGSSGIGDANYCGSTSGVVQVTVMVPTPLIATTSPLPIGIVNGAYPSTQLMASGGVPPYTWTVIQGSLPTGFPALPTGGLITGTPTVANTFNFTVQVQDSQGNTNTAGLSITINAALQISTMSVPTNVVAGVAYAPTSLTASGGVPPYRTWTVNSGSLPGGLSLSPTAGVIFGTPTAAAVRIPAYTFTVQVTDKNGDIATSAMFSISVGGLSFTPSASPITISTPGQMGSQLITVTGENGFAGMVTLMAIVTDEPANAIDLPTCNFGAPDSNFTAPNIITFTNVATIGTATITCSSTAAVSRVLFRPTNSPVGPDWPLATAAASLVSFLLLLSVPRQLRWGFAPLAVLFVMIVAAGVGCGGGGTSGGTSGGGGGGGNAGTTLGAYTVTVTATPTLGAAQSTPVTVNVN